MKGSRGSNRFPGHPPLQLNADSALDFNKKKNYWPVATKELLPQCSRAADFQMKDSRAAT